MADYDFVTVDVFTETRFGGNPLAVLPDARGLDTATMQSLAREFNLSETTFVLPPDDPGHDARVRIFTPAGEMPFAGHPNVGTGFVLAQRAPPGKARFLFEEIAGLVEVAIERDDGGTVIGAEIAAPQPLSLAGEVAVDLVAACAGLEVADIRTAAHRPVIASVGTPFVIAEVASQAALVRAAVDLAAFRRAAAGEPQGAERFQLHLYYVADRAATGLVHVRMFAPLAGVIEDPATGSAALALAALLLSLDGQATELRHDMRQGVEMGRPSRLLTTARRGAGGSIRAWVRGSCVPVMRGVVTV